jgi:hypothetical protein
MTKDGYIGGVLLKMNELKWSDSFEEVFAGADETNVEAIVVGSYMSAWRKSVQMLPKMCFVQSTLKGNGRLYYSRSDGTGCVLLPGDFYRLTSFRMRGWQRAVYVAEEETEVTAQVQANEYVRGNYELPVCTLAPYAPLYEGMAAEGNGRMLRYYSLPRNREHRIEFGFYVPVTKDIAELDARDVMGEKMELYEPLQWIHAGVAFGVLGKTDWAKQCDVRAMEVGG